MRPKRLDIDLETVDPDGLSDGVSTAVVQILLTGALTTGADLDGLADGNSSAGTSITLDGALTLAGKYTDATDSPRHIHILDLGGDAQTGATYTITGTGTDKRSLVENIAGPAASGFVITTGRFATVTSIAIASPAAGSTVDIGVNGVFISVDGLGRRLSITDTGTDDQTGATYTITGTDADGKAQTEDRAGPGSTATVEITKYFKTVTSVTIASPIATSTADLGTIDEAASRTIVLDHYANVAATIGSLVSGTLNYDVEVTVENPIKNAGEQFAPFTLTDQSDLAWINDTVNVGKTASFIGALGTPGLRAMRVIINSHSAAAEMQVWVTQPHGNK